MAMSYSGPSFFLSSLLILLVSLSTVAQPNLLGQFCSSERGNYTNSSRYEADLNSLLTSFSNIQVDYGFYNSSVGEVNGIGLCRGDLSPETCRSCISNSSQELRRLCPNYKEAVAYYDQCMLRYSNRSIFGTKDTRDIILPANTGNFSDMDYFTQQRAALLLDLRGKAASGGSDKKYSTSETSVDFETIFALVQCTPDLEYQECYDCLDEISNVTSNFMKYKRGGHAFVPSCNFRFETNRFYNLLRDAPPPPSRINSSDPPTNDSTTGDGNNTKKIVVITISAIAGAAIVLGFFLYLSIFSRKSRRDSGEQKSEEILLNVLDRPTGTHFMEGQMHDQDDTGETYFFNLTTILVATNNFSDSNKLGEGGFGPVYKGTLPNGKEIAVKRLSVKSGQGMKELRNEVMVIAKLQHKNLVRLLGCCIKGDEKLLVYEYMVNTSLDAFLFDPTKRKQLDWVKRAAIIGGIARGLLYLHEDSRLKIIHRDLKASNVLLDEEMNPKISDFGTARIFGNNQIEASTNKIVGTFGYMAPEYAMHGHFSVKTDVYSFGVMVLEMVTGQRNHRFRSGENIEHLLSSAWTNWREGTTTNIVDPMLRVGPTSEVIMKYIHIGLLCVQENEVDRPTMASVVLMLNGQSLNLPIPSHPAFFIHNGSQLGMPLVTSRLDQLSLAEVTITDPQPR